MSTAESASSGAPRRPFYRRRKSCPFTGPNAPKIDYKDTRLLSRYIQSVARSFRPVLRPYRRKSSVNSLRRLSALAS